MINEVVGGVKPRGSPDGMRQYIHDKLQLIDGVSRLSFEKYTGFEIQYAAEYLAEHDCSGAVPSGWLPVSLRGR
jgi:hypothetical protein